MKSCPYFKECGSCQYKLEDYEASLKDKVSKMKEYLKPFKVGEVVENPEVYHYRHKIIFSFFEKNKKLEAGFYTQGSRKIVKVDDCKIQAEIANQILNDFLKIANEKHLQAYDVKSRRGCLRHLLMRVSSDGKVLCCFVIGSKEFYGSKEIVAKLKDLHPEIIGVDVVVNTRDTSVVIEGHPKSIFGKGILRDTMGEFVFNITSDSFYQVNPKMAHMIYEDVIKRLDIQKNDIVLDAYSGIGTISMFASKKAKEVIGVEINKKAHMSAVSNVRQNGIKNVRFVNSDVASYLINHPFDILIVDPPRAGMSKAFIDHILKAMPKKIAYVSCDPETMHRDLKILSSRYHVEPITLYDQFGFTKHLEALTILHKK